MVKEDLFGKLRMELNLMIHKNSEIDRFEALLNIGKSEKKNNHHDR